MSNKLKFSKLRLTSSSSTVVEKSKSNLISTFFENHNKNDSFEEPILKSVREIVSVPDPHQKSLDDKDVKIKSIEAFFESKPKTTKPKTTLKFKSTANARGKRGRGRTRNQVDIRTALKRDADNELKKDSGDFDDNEIKLAIALSKSMTGSGNSSDENSIPDNQNATKNGSSSSVKTILEQYGFKCKNNYTDFDMAKILDGSQTKSSKYLKRPTKLILTTDVSRQQIIKENIEKVLVENVRDSVYWKGKDENHDPKRLYSDFLNSMTEMSSEIFEQCSSPLSENLFRYYIQDLFIPSMAQCGSLLREWEKIPGWDECSIYKPNSSMESLQLQQSRILSNENKETDESDTTIIYELNNSNKFLPESSSCDLFEGCEDVEMIDASKIAPETELKIESENVKEKFVHLGAKEDAENVILLESSDDENVEDPKEEKSEVPKTLTVADDENVEILEEPENMEMETEPADDFNFDPYEDLEYYNNVGNFNEDFLDYGKAEETLIEIMGEEEKEELDINMSISHILEPAVANRIPTPVDLENDMLSDSDCELSQELEKEIVKPKKVSNDCYEFKRDCVTPEPDFKNMNAITLKMELNRYGLKNLPKKKAISILQFIYNELHPKIKIVVDKENLDLDDSRNFLNATDLATNIICDSSDEIFKPELVEDEEVILPGGRKTKKFLTCPVPLHIAFYNMVRSNKLLQNKILIFEKFNLDDLLNHFKRLGTNYQENDVVKFLDKRCITYKKEQKNLVKYAKKQFSGGFHKKKLKK